MIKAIHTFSFVALLNICSTVSVAQFAPAAGQPGSTAIHKDDPSIIAWASSCELSPGWINIQDTTLGKVIDSGCLQTLGAAGEGGIVSLGDKGSITVEFTQAIVDRDGFDFAIFENGFSDTFLELAHVEVSSDGIDFIKFPSTSNSDTTIQVGPFGAVNPTNIDNLAGKYRANYGTPFDLAELVDSLVNINHITHIRIIDVVGSINPLWGSADQYGRMINDPFPTPFSSSGFDLDAVAVINNETNTVNTLGSGIHIYPNPIKSGQIIHIKSNYIIRKNKLINSLGQQIVSGKTTQLKLPHQLPSGLYHLEILSEVGKEIHKIRVY